jgi:RES domain-containing protein
MNPAGCASLALGPHTGTWYRAIQPRFWTTSLATGHTRTIPSRFAGGTVARPEFEILYLAEDHQVALFEVQALLGSPLPPAAFRPNPAGAWVIINVNVTLSSVADLCLPAQRRLVRTSVQELTGDWRGYLLRNPTPTLSGPYWTNVPTQRLGAALDGVPNLEGFTTFSAKVPTHKNLVIFPQKLLPGSRLSFSYTDPSTGQTQNATIP